MARPGKTQVHVIINDAALARLHDRGKPIGDFLDKVGRSMVSKAKIAAPSRTGNLKKSIYASHDRVNQHASRVRVQSFAGYAWFVHEGTQDHEGYMTLYARAGWYDIFPGRRRRVDAARGGYENTYLNRIWFVRGIHGPSITPFLDIARDATWAQYSRYISRVGARLLLKGGPP